ncbi:zinc finger protein 34 isoform X1 [Rhinichthys klamathensis goyatoka]|uniref:zinc finger protein 34 isoform X1 n=1 Tax=Rhinichthys klamathensis goyatoka TaxID=3034132 RepID=UPI0024B4EF4B|nr:zinc finger protein 34 isoform X1 [Rhinichthys klamathensis goyatoka]
MSASADIHATLASILERFAKCALLEMSRAVEQEMTRRKMEVETLMLKLQFTESELRSARKNQSNLRSVGTQVNTSGQRGVTAHSREAQTDPRSQEKIVVKNLSEERAHFSHAADVNSQLLKQEESVTPLKEPEEEELSGLEFEMKIEQVEKLVDQTLNQVQAKQKCKEQNHCHDRNTRLWCSGKAFDHPENLVELEQHSQSFTDPYGMEDPTTTSTQSGLLAVLQNESFGVADIEYDLNLQDSHRSSPSTSESESTPFNTLPSSHSSSCLPKTLPQSLNAGKHTGPKPFRCEECGKGFPQKGRLLTHKLVHMDEKPFRCEECGKSFTQRKRLLTHRLVHTGEKPFCCQLCGKTFSRQDNCLRHMRLHSDNSSSSVYFSP